MSNFGCKEIFYHLALVACLLTYCGTNAANVEKSISIRKAESVSGVKNHALNFMTSDPGMYYGNITLFKNAPRPFIHGPAGTISLWFKAKKTKTISRLIGVEALFSIVAHVNGIARDCDNIIPANKLGNRLEVFFNKTKMSLSCLGNIGKSRISFRVPGAIKYDKWYNLAISWKTGILSLYLDAKLMKSVKTDNPGNVFSFSRYFFLAGDQYGFTHGFHGALDEIMVFNRALSSSEIVDIVKRHDFTSDPLLSFYMPCDTNSSATIKRTNLDSVTDSKIIFRASLGEWRYVTVGEPISMNLTIPPGLPEKLKFDLSIDLDDGENVLKLSNYIFRDQHKKTNKSFSHIVKQCGMYKLKLTLKNKNGKTVFKRIASFAVIVKLPSANNVPNSSPCGGSGVHDIAIGAKWIRLWCAARWGWSSLEPRKNHFHWSYLDYTVKKIRSKGGQIVLCVVGTPGWASSKAALNSRLGEKLTNTNCDVIGGGGKSTAAYPPANMADFENFLRHLFRRYKGKIAAYQLWNEPNSGHFMGSAAEYVTMLKIMHRVLREEKDKAIIVGGCGAPGYASWTQKIVNLGAAPYMNVLSVHDYCYSDPISWHNNGNLIRASKAVKKVLGHPLAIWSDEMGTIFSPLGKKEFVKKFGSDISMKVGVIKTWNKQSICWDIQSALIVLMEGKHNKYFWHGTNCARLSAKGVAYAALAKAVSNRKDVKALNAGNLLLGVLINTNDNSYTAALFANGRRTVLFPLSAKTVNGMDMYGNPLKYTTNNGLLKLSITKDIIYLFDVPADFHVLPVITVKLQQKVKAGSEITGELLIENPYLHKERFILTCKAPSGWQGTLSDSDIILKPREKKTIALKIQCGNKTENAEILISADDSGGNSFKIKHDIFSRNLLRLPEIITPVDIASEESWKKLQRLDKIESIEHVKIGRQNPMFKNLPHWNGSKDLSYTVYAGWRKEGIYLWIDVIDDKFYPGKASSTPWKGDAVELFLDFVPRKKISGKRLFTEQIIIVPSVSNKFTKCSLKYYDTAKYAKVVFYGRKTANGYIIAGKVVRPHGRFGQGKIIGLDIAVDDCDNPDAGKTRKTQMLWHGDENNHLSSYKWGRFILTRDNDEVRIDISAGKSGPKLKFTEGSDMVRGGNPKWKKLNPELKLCINAPVNTKWRDYSFSFVPDAAGRVDLELMGSWSKNKSNRHYIDVDSIKLTGAVLKNGDFKDAKTGWRGSGFIKDIGKAGNAETCAVVNHDKRLLQSLQVESGQTVKVSFRARLTTH